MEIRIIKTTNRELTDVDPQVLDLCGVRSTELLKHCANRKSAAEYPLRNLICTSCHFYRSSVMFGQRKNTHCPSKRVYRHGDTDVWASGWPKSHCWESWPDHLHGSFASLHQFAHTRWHISLTSPSWCLTCRRSEELLSSTRFLRWTDNLWTTDQFL